MAIVGSLPTTLVNGTTADAAQVMLLFDYLVAQVNANAAKNGVNSDITSLTALTTRIPTSGGGTSLFYSTTVSTGSANSQVVATTVPAGFALTTGYRVLFMAGYSNTGATQFNIGATGLKDVLKQTPSGLEPLVGGEIVAGNVVQAMYDGTQFILLEDQSLEFGAAASLASASTVDLGTVGSRNVLITGTTAITALGSSAVAGRPIYLVRFAAALTLTYNGTSLILPGAQDITTAAGDAAVFEYLGSGNWRCLHYQRASGLPVISPAYSTPVRQTVLAGPVSSGLPAFLPATDVDLNLQSVNITSSTPLVVTAAGGSGIAGDLNRFGQATSDITWSGLTNGVTNYLFVTVNADGTLTPGFTTLAPIYQMGGSASVTNGQYTFIVSEMKMYVGNGATASQVWVVFVGEAVTAGSAVSSTVAYAYRGFYEYTDTGSLPAAVTQVLKNHNLGVSVGVTAQVSAVNVIAEGNYSVGDVLFSIGTAYAGPGYTPIPVAISTKTVSFITGFYNFIALNKITGALLTLTAANWHYRLTVYRGW